MSDLRVDTFAMSGVPVLQRRIVWVCPNGCPAYSITERADVHQQMHVCQALHGLMAPLIEEGQRVKVEAVEREDFIAGEVVTKDENGRPIMAVHTTREEGEDRLIFAPAATMEVSYG